MFALAIWMFKICNHPYLSSSYSGRENDKASEVWRGWANEWFEQKSKPWVYQISKNLPSTMKQGLVTTFIDSFRRSMGTDGSASHPKSKVWSESFEITLMHTRSYEPWTLLDPQVLFQLFLLGTRRVYVWGLLVIVFSEFYHQHSFGFHTFRTIIPMF